VRTNFFAEIDDGNGSRPAQVDDLNRTSVRAGLSHPCVSVDGNVAEATVWGDSDFVSVNVNSHGGQNLFGHRIHKQNAVLHLVRNQQKFVWARVPRDAGRKQETCEKANPDETVVHNGPFSRGKANSRVTGSVALAATLEVLRTRVAV
jgi:hypothetical protein